MMYGTLPFTSKTHVFVRGRVSVATHPKDLTDTTPGWLITEVDECPVLMFRAPIA
jgi:hypothetical protein